MLILTWLCHYWTVRSKCLPYRIMLNCTSAQYVDFDAVVGMKMKLFRFDLIWLLFSLLGVLVYFWTISVPNVGQKTLENWKISQLKKHFCKWLALKWDYVHSLHFTVLCRKNTKVGQSHVFMIVDLKQLGQFFHQNTWLVVFFQVLKWKCCLKWSRQY